MSLEAEVALLKTAVVALVTAVQDATRAMGGAATAATAAKQAAPVPTPAPAADTKAPAAPAAPKLNKDGETEDYTKNVKPALMSFVKSHGREFVLGWLAKIGFDATGLTPIKGGEKSEGQYVAVIAHMAEGAKQPSPIAPIA